MSEHILVFGATGEWPSILVYSKHSRVDFSPDLHFRPIWNWILLRCIATRAPVKPFCTKPTETSTRTFRKSQCHSDKGHVWERHKNGTSCSVWGTHFCVICRSYIWIKGDGKRSDFVSLNFTFADLEDSLSLRQWNWSFLCWWRTITSGLWYLAPVPIRPLGTKAALSGNYPSHWSELSEEVHMKNSEG